jgi:iron complex outermembrane receptor protein
MPATQARFLRFGLLAPLVAICCTGSLAYAEEADQGTGKEGEKLEEIVITGTLIRGVAPTGAEMINVTTEDIKSTGATSNDQLLASVPQVSNFFNIQPQIAAGTNASLQICHVLMQVSIIAAAQ